MNRGVSVVPRRVDDRARRRREPGPVARVCDAPVRRRVTTPTSHGALINRYCVTCHNQRAKTGGLALDTLSMSNIPAGAETWEKVIRKVRGGQMPPAGMPRRHRRRSTAWSSIWRRRSTRRRSPPRALRHPAIHRLNRSEYGNAIRDLFALDVDVAALLPPDEEAYGFDNNATVLNISTSLMERYLSAAWKISSLAVASPRITPSLETFRVRGDLSQHDHVAGPADRHTRRHRHPPLFSRRRRVRDQPAALSRDGQHRPRPRTRSTISKSRSTVSASCSRGSAARRTTGELPTADARRRRDGEALSEAPEDHGRTARSRRRVPQEELGDDVELLQPFERERLDPITPVGIPELDKVTIEGPFNATRRTAPEPLTDVHLPAGQNAAAPDAACARTILSSLARRAYRRPVKRRGDDAARRLSTRRSARSGGSFDAGIEGALRLPARVIREFLYPGRTGSRNAARDRSYRISDLELASRLSFFIWSSIPDEELLVSPAGQAAESCVLEQQVRRMLKDERARALGSNFAGQWLYLRNLRRAPARRGRLPGLRPQPPRGPPARNGDALREHRARRQARVDAARTRTTRSSTSGWRAITACPNVYGTQFRRVAA